MRFAIAATACILIFMAGMSAATQFVAGVFDHHAALGSRVAFSETLVLYPPWAVLGWSSSFAEDFPRPFELAHAILFAGLLAAFAPAAFLARRQNKPKPFGAAAWGTFADASAAGLLAQSGTVLGKLDGEILCHDGPGHQLLIGASRSGKGRGHIVPTLLAWGGSAVVLDVKGELADGDPGHGFPGTGGFRETLGPVIRFAPTSPLSAAFNPLLEVRRGVNEVRDVQNIVAIIADPAGDGRHSDFWDKAARQVMEGVILHVIYAEPLARKSLSVVREKLADLRATAEEMRTTLHRVNPITGEPEVHPEVLHGATSFKAGEERLQASLKATAESFFGLFADPLVAEKTSTSDFRLSDLMCGDEPVTLFLQPPPSDAARLMPLMRLFLNQLARSQMEYLGRGSDGRPKRHKLLLCLDEFPQLGKMPFFETAMGAFAGYGLKAYLVCQSLNHILRAYGRDNVILDNCHIVTAFAAADMDTAKKIADMAGEAREVRPQYSEQRPRPILGARKGSITWRDECRPLLLAADVRQLAPGEQLTFVAGEKPLRTQKIRFDEEPVFAARLRPASATPARLTASHDWAGAEWLRREQAAHAIPFLGPAGEGEPETSPEASEYTGLRDALLAEAERNAGTPLGAVQEVLAWSVEFHRREAKPMWWKYFDRRGWSEPELFEDMDCLAGVTRTETPAVKPTRGNLVHEYQFDIDQPYKGTAKAFHVLDHEKLKVSVKDYDPDSGIISFGSKLELPARMNLVPDEFVSPKPIPAAILAMVQDTVQSGYAPSAIMDFLLRKRPRIRGNADGDILDPSQPLLASVIEAVRNLEGSYLCIQGPPGAGKTYTARHIIARLLRDGKKVGIASNSHKAINNLLAGVADQVAAEKINARLAKVQKEANDTLFDRGDVERLADVKNLAVSGSICLGGTAWAFANPEVRGAFDYLFVDEAGQVSIANLIGMSAATKNIVLMGDQMQLSQPIQGSHPGESGLSILDYLLEGKATIPAALGVFLPKTYRMHPDVCRVISEQVYDGRLGSDEATTAHVVDPKGPIIRNASGICFVPVEHEGNTQGSDEEVDMIRRIARELIAVPIWPDEDGRPRTITLNDILFVAPYNFQVNKLKAALGPGARVGSVDKFQGQEAPVVILSMCTSDAAENPRGIEFLFSKNRLNVAISRAQALAIVVANPKLANTTVTSLEQMQQINFFAELVSIGSAR